MFVSIKEIAEKKQQDVVDELVKIEGNNWSIDKHSMVDYTYYYNNILSMSDKACFMVNNCVMVPLPVLSRIFSSNVEWDEIDGIVHINSIETDEGYYNQYKADKEKPLVIDYEYNNERCKVPQLNIEHPNAEAINNRILEVNKDGVEAILEAEKKGYDLGILNLRYQYSVNGDILSLLYITNYDAGDISDMHSVNYDLKNNRELSFDEVINLCGQDKDEQIESTQKKLQDLFVEINPSAEKNISEGHPMYVLYEAAGNDYCYSDK